MSEQKIKKGNFKTYTEKNGSKIALWKLDGLNSLTILVTFCDGVAYENDDDWGISHLLEHVHLLGTPQYPSTTEISSFMEEEGGKISAFSTRDSTGYWVKTPSWGATKAFKILTHVLSNNRFSRESFESEKGIIIQEMEREKANPRFYNGLHTEGLVLRPRRISRYPLGDEKSINNLTIERVTDYKSSVYGCKNCFITVFGGFEQIPIEQEIENFLSNMPPGSERKREYIENNNNNSEKLFFLRYPSLSQANIVIGWGIKYPIKKDWLLWSLLNTVLGVGFSCRLYKTLREKHHLTYLVTTMLRIYRDAGTYRITFDTKPENTKKAIDLIKEIFEDITEGEISESELERSKARLFGNMVLRMEDTFEYARFLNNLVMNEAKPLTLNDINNELRKLNIEDISSLMKEHLRFEDLIISSAGSKEANEIIKKLFNLEVSYGNSGN